MKEIPGFPGYSVTKDGRVWSARRRDNRGRSYGGQWLCPDFNRLGYLRVRLSRSGRKERRFVHRLVLEAFVGPCPDGMECCHNNGIKTDNYLENLRWGTHKENQQDMVHHGTAIGFKRKGVRNPGAKLTDAQVREIIADYNTTGASQSGLAVKYGVARTTISGIVQRIRWKHI